MRAHCLWHQRWQLELWIQSSTGGSIYFSLQYMHRHWGTLSFTVGAVRAVVNRPFPLLEFALLPPFLPLFFPCWSASFCCLYGLEVKTSLFCPFACCRSYAFWQRWNPLPRIWCWCWGVCTATAGCWSRAVGTTTNTGCWCWAVGTTAAGCWSRTVGQGRWLATGTCWRASVLSFPGNIRIKNVVLDKKETVLRPVQIWSHTFLKTFNPPLPPSRTFFLLFSKWSSHLFW